MDWQSFWQIIKDIVLPHLARLVLNIIAFVIIGIIFSIFIILLYRKNKVLTRKNSIYSLIIKIIYLPGIFIVCLIFSFQLGFARGVYKILKLENPQIIDGIYLGTVGQLLSSEKEKDNFVNEMKLLAQKAQISNTNFPIALKDGIAKQSKDESMNTFSAYLVKKYKEEVYSAFLFGLCYAADIKFDNRLNYSDFDNVLDVISKTDKNKVEKSIKFAMAQKLQKVFRKQYTSIVVYMLLTCILIISVPLIEFFIYKIWIEKHLKQG